MWYDGELGAADVVLLVDWSLSGRKAVKSTSSKDPTVSTK
jgi:hypothetical protein